MTYTLGFICGVLTLYFIIGLLFAIDGWKGASKKDEFTIMPRLVKIVAFIAVMFVWPCISEMPDNPPSTLMSVTVGIIWTILGVVLSRNYPIIATICFWVGAMDILVAYEVVKKKRHENN